MDWQKVFKESLPALKGTRENAQTWLLENMRALGQCHGLITVLLFSTFCAVCRNNLVPCRCSYLQWQFFSVPVTQVQVFQEIYLWKFYILVPIIRDDFSGAQIMGLKKANWYLPASKVPLAKIAAVSSIRTTLGNRAEIYIHRSRSWSVLLAPDGQTRLT